MNNNVKQFADKFLPQYTRQVVCSPDVVNALEKVVYEDDIEVARSLSIEDYRRVLNGLMCYTSLLYQVGAKAVAAHYSFMLVDAVVKTGNKSAMVHVMRNIRNLHYDTFEMAITHLPEDVRNSILVAERIAFFVSDAIRGIVVGTIISIVILLVRSGLGI